MSSLPVQSSFIVTYQSTQIPGVWHYVKDYIQLALDRGSNYTLDDIYQGLCKAEMQLWTWQGSTIEAAMVTTIQEQDGILFCLFLVLGGSKMNEWIHLLPAVEAWAKEQGCTEMRIYGRIGWAKMIGYKVEYTKMSKQI